MTQIRVELQLADGSFTSGILRAGQSLSEFNQELLRTNPRLAGMQNAAGSVIRSMERIESSSKGALATLRDISVVTGLVSLGISKATAAANGWLGDIVRVNAEMEKLNYQMRAMSTAVDPIKDAANNVKYLREQATQMPFSLKTLTSGFTKLKAVGIDPMDGSLKSIADGIAAFGGSDQEFNRTILGITQAAGKGVLQMEELRQQIGESMPIAMNLLARSMGMTVGQLAKEISTGTVASIPALQKLTAELDRAYGGTAQRMMQTFSGQMTQLYTNLQNLATSEGGKGFFDQVKIQLREINQFLSSDMAQKMAVSFGQSLASMIQGLREVVSTVWQFREEIMTTGKVLAAGFGIMVATRALSALRGSIRETVLEMKTLAPAWDTARNRMAAAATSFQNTGASAYTAGRAVRGLGSVIGVAASGAAILGPWIAAAGMAAALAAEYFGLLSDKIDDAYQQLVKYGAESKKQAEDTIGSKEKQLVERLEAMRKAATMASPGVWDKEIKETEAQLAALRKAAPQIIADAGKQEIARDMERYRAEISDGLEGIQREYNKIAIARDKAYAEELNNVENSEDGKAKIRQRYIDDQIVQQKKVINDTIALYDQQIDAMQAAFDKANAADKDKFRARLDYLRSSRITEQAKLNTLSRDNFNLERASGGDDEKKQVAAGETMLKNLNADIAKIQANINGASGAVAEMNSRIAAGDFGTIKEGGEEVKRLHEELLSAAAAKEKLDKVMKGNQKADQDLEKIKQDIAEKRLELMEREQGRNLNDAQRMQLKLDNGGYFGLGPYENIKKAIGEVVGSLNAQGVAADNVGTFMRQNAFGDETEKHVVNVTNRVKELREAIMGVGTSLRGLDFASLGKELPALNVPGSNLPNLNSFSGVKTVGANLMSKNMGIFGDPRSAGWKEQNITSVMASNGMTVQVHKAAADAFKGFLNDLISTGYDIKSLGGHNVRNKRGGNSLSEHAFGNAIDINPATNPYGKEFITDMPANIRELAAKWNLSWGGDWKSIKDAMHFEWKGGKTAGTNEPAPAPYRSAPDNGALKPFQPTVIDNQVEKTNQLTTALSSASDAYFKLGKQESDLDLADWIKKTEAETKDLGMGAEEAGKRYQQLKKAIMDGEFDKSNNPEDRKPEAERFKAALAAAKAYDEAKKKVAENDKLDKRNSAEAIKFEEKRVELNRRIAEIQNKVKDPKWVPDSSELQKLQTDLDGYVADVLKRADGDVNNAAYKQALETRRNMLAGQRQLESLDAQVAFNKETNDLRNSLLTQSQLRDKNLKEELARVDTWLEQQRKNGANEVEVVRMAEEQKALIRRKYQQDMSPMQKQFAEWGDMQNNLAQASARWMDSLAGGISDLIMGTGDLKSVLAGIAKDMVNMGVKAMMSGMFSKNGSSAAPGSKKSPFRASMNGKTGKSGMGKFGIAHTGGIIGSSALGTKLGSAAMFANAPKFHTGGIIDGLLPSEVPIIAKKGEGVFTPEQMAAMGSINAGAQNSVAIQSTVNVNASGGTPEQNDDLARKVSRQVEGQIRATVQQEMQKASRPGGYMQRR